MPEDAQERVLGHTTHTGTIAAYVVVWLLLALVAGTAVFLGSERAINLASHDAVLRPDLSGDVVVRTGPVLPDLRTDSGGRIGVDIRLGKTEAPSSGALVERYALLASQPEGQEAKVRQAVTDLAYGAALRGAALGLIPVLVWLLVGPARRRALAGRLRSRRGAVAGVVLTLVVLALWQPWATEEDTLASGREWTPLATFLGPGIPLPAEAAGIEVRGDVTTGQTRRLIGSAIETYQKSKDFYVTAAEEAALLDLREPDEDETVVALVSDRHDNIGMDAVARAVADAAGATAVFNAGDDTSTGRPWEAFSLDSVTAAFEDLDRLGVAGNHDNGEFVSTYLADSGWTMLDGEVVEGPGGATLMGVDDPRASGLGSWRDETGLSFGEVEERVADAACDSEDRISTVLVHDANLGREALARGCVDLVVGGHLHVREGPIRVVGENGEIGWSYTTGTTGGSAYAIAIGGKPRRAAEISLLTYRDGRPVGVESVLLQTNGRFDVAAYVPIPLSPDDTGTDTGTDIRDSAQK